MNTTHDYVSAARKKIAAFQDSTGGDPHQILNDYPSGGGMMKYLDLDEINRAEEQSQKLMDEVPVLLREVKKTYGGLSAVQVLSGVDSGMISKMAHGDMKATYNTVFKIARALAILEREGRVKFV